MTETLQFYDQIDYIVENYINVENEKLTFKNERFEDYFIDENYIIILNNIIHSIKMKVCKKETNEIVFSKVQDDNIKIPDNIYKTPIPISHLIFINLKINKEDRPFEAAIQYYLKTQYIPNSIDQKAAENTVLFRCKAYQPIFIKNIVEEYNENYAKEGNEIELCEVLKCVIRGEKQDTGIDWIALNFNYVNAKPNLPLIFDYLFYFRKIDADLLKLYRKQTGSNLSISVFGQTKTSETKDSVTTYTMLTTDTGHNLITDALCMAAYITLIGDILYGKYEFKFKFCFHSDKCINIQYKYPIKKESRFSYEKCETDKTVPIPDIETYNKYMIYKNKVNAKSSINFMKNWVKSNFNDVKFTFIPVSCLTFGLEK